MSLFDKYSYFTVVYLYNLDSATYYVSCFYFFLNFKIISITNSILWKKMLIVSKGNKCPIQRQLKYFFIIIIIFKFIYLFLASLGLHCCPWLSLVAASGVSSLLRCAGFSLQCSLLLWSTGSRHTGFTSCDTRAQ